MQQLVGFATSDNPRTKVCDLTSEILAVVDFIQLEMLDNRIEVRTHLPSSVIRAQIDQGRLRQIMLNLLQNAQQVMNDGGRIDVNLKRRRGMAEIAVSDSGPGVANEDLERIFEPFFSTRSDGTGLGLALVKRFVDEVDGEIECESNPQGGATFRIRLHAATASQRS
jgi:signal transduction histidine kinase